MLKLNLKPTPTPCLEEKEKEEEAEGAALIPAYLLYEEILHRLPSNHLLHLKLVSKEWRLLISSPQFIQKHLERSKAECNSARLLTLNKSADLEMIDMEENIAKKISLRNVKSFLGSCDGLALCRLLDGKIAAVNPSTGKYVVRTPNPSIRNDFTNTSDLSFICSWFGHHPCTGEYVLVFAHSVRSPNRTIIFKVYSLSRNTNNPLLSSSTHLINEDFCYGFDKIGTFLHGQLHCLVWVGSLGPSFEIVILVHSFQTNGNIERMRCPNIPNISFMSCPTLGVFDGCLFIISWDKEEKMFVLWVMKEYGVKGSWTKFAKLEGYNMLNYGHILNMYVPIVFCPNGYAILNGNSEAKILKARSNYNVNVFGGIMCIDSLVSPHSVLKKKKEEEIVVD